MRVSRKFCQALKLSEIPAYRLAWRAGIHPNTLSKLVIGYLKPNGFDPRLIKVGSQLGLKPEEVFEISPSSANISRNHAEIEEAVPQEAIARQIGKGVGP